MVLHKMEWTRGTLHTILRYIALESQLEHHQLAALNQMEFN